MDYLTAFGNLLISGEGITLALLTVGITIAAAYIKGRIKNKTIATYLSDAVVIVGSVVKDMNSSVVADLKERSADGKLTQAEAKEVRDLAIDKAKRLMGEKVFTYITAHSFGGSADAADKFLGGEVEAVVKAVKGQGSK